MLDSVIYVLKNKGRFEFNGLVWLEDLFDLSFEDLDRIYRLLRKEEREIRGESLISCEIDNHDIKMLQSKIDVVKYVFDLKQKEAFEQQRLHEKAEKKQKILSIINDKQDDSLKAKSIEELEEMLSEL